MFTGHQPKMKMLLNIEHEENPSNCQTVATNISAHLHACTRTHTNYIHTYITQEYTCVHTAEIPKITYPYLRVLETCETKFHDLIFP